MLEKSFCAQLPVILESLRLVIKYYSINVMLTLFYILDKNWDLMGSTWSAMIQGSVHIDV